MMGSEGRTESTVRLRASALRIDGAGKGARTPDLRMSQTFRGLSLSSRAFAGRPMSPTRHQLRHPGNGRFDRTAEYEYIHSSRPFG